MTTKKTTAKATPSGNPRALRIGSRVRCTDDDVAGRIVWANAVSVKIAWDDGEQVTWKRDSLADRALEFLDADKAAVAAPQGEQPPTSAPAEEATAQEKISVPEEMPMPTPDLPTSEPLPEAPASDPIPEATTPKMSTDVPLTESAPAERTRAPFAPVTATAVSENPAPQTGVAKQPATATAPQRARKGKKPEGVTAAKMLSALDAAAKVLAEEGRPLSCREMIGVMASKGYWSSPGGQTPAATLCSALLRELATKGEKSRFRKVGRGQFAYHAAE
jgi:hypothetical protein